MRIEKQGRNIKSFERNESHDVSTSVCETDDSELFQSWHLEFFLLVFFFVFFF